MAKIKVQNFFSKSAFPPAFTVGTGLPAVDLVATDLVAFVLLLLTNKVALSATSFSIGEKREFADEAILIAPLLETFLALKFSTRDRDPRTAEDEDVNANIIVLFLRKFCDWFCVCVCVCVFLVDRSDDQLNNYSNWTFRIIKNIFSRFFCERIPNFAAAADAAVRIRFYYYKVL